MLYNTEINSIVLTDGQTISDNFSHITNNENISSRLDEKLSANSGVEKHLPHYNIESCFGDESFQNISFSSPFLS